MGNFVRFFYYLLAISYVNPYKFVVIFFCPGFTIILAPPLGVVVGGGGVCEGSCEVKEGRKWCVINEDLFVECEGVRRNKYMYVCMYECMYIYKRGKVHERKQRYLCQVKCIKDEECKVLLHKKM